MIVTNVFCMYYMSVCIDLNFIIYLFILCFFYFCADIDGLGVMRLISGIIAVEEKDRVARVGKVMKYVSIYNHFSHPWQNSIYVYTLRY